jgi:sugar phosphate isomerase/epimerase
MEHIWKTGEEPETIRRQAANLDLRLSLHGASYDVNLTSSNPGIRRESFRQAKESIQIARRLGTGSLVLHPGRLSTTKGDPDEYWRLMEEAFMQLDRKAKQEGVKVGIEAMEKKSRELYLSPPEIERMLGKGWSHIGLTVDIAHIASITDHARFFAGLKKEWILHAHLSDFSERTTHLPLGQGTIDINRVLKELQKKYDGLVILEGFVRGKGRKTLRCNTDYLRKVGWL